MGSREVNHGLYERPYGRLPGIGLGLALCMYAAAVLSVVNRLLPAVLPGEAAARCTAMTPILTGIALGAVTFLLFGAAAKLSDSVVDVGAFLLGMAAAVCRILTVPLARVSSAVLLLYWLFMLAGFLLLSVNRENTRDARRSAAAAVPLLFVCFAAGVLAQYAASGLTEGRMPVLRAVRMMAAGGYVQFFAGIAAYVAMAMTFLFLRTPTRAILYRKRLTE